VNDRQRELLEQARASTDAARLLLESGHIGFAASRVYYASFYVACSLLEGEGLKFASHSAVIAAFGQHFARSGRIPPEFHRFLRTAEELRRSGDYGPFGAVSPEEVEQGIQRAESFLKLAEDLIRRVPPEG